MRGGVAHDLEPAEIGVGCPQEPKRAADVIDGDVADQPADVRA